MTAGEVNITEVPLTTVEETRLTELENVVETGLDTFLQVGLALAEIQQAKLYRQTHGSFDRYLADRFPALRRAHAYRLVAAAGTVEQLSSMGDTIPLPANERQARELAGLPAETAAAVMVETVAEVGEKVTAADIARTRERVAPPEPAPAPTAAAAGAGSADQQQPPPRPAPTRRRAPLPDAWRTALWEFNKAADRIKRLVDDDRFPAFVTTGDRAIYGPIQRALAMSTDLEYFLERAVDGRIKYEARRGWVKQDDDEEVDIWEFLNQYNDICETRERRRREAAAAAKEADGADVVIRVVRHSAVVERGWPTVWGHLQTLGADRQRDTRTGLPAFPQQFADDVQAAAELRGQRVLLIRDGAAS